MLCFRLQNKAGDFDFRQQLVFTFIKQLKKTHQRLRRHFGIGDAIFLQLLIILLVLRQVVDEKALER